MASRLATALPAPYHGRLDVMSDTSQLGAVRVPDVRGGFVQLDALWRDRAVVLVWLRHYG